MWSIASLVWSLWSIVAVVVAFLFYRIFTTPSQLFAKQGVPFQKPWPLFGSMGKLIFCQESMYDMLINTYNEFKGHRFYGMFDFNQPVYALRDPALIKQITVKDFEHFLDHLPFMTNMKQEPFLTGQRWRDMRATLSPAFTDSKMREMFQFVAECSEHATQILLKEVKASPKPISYEMKDVFTRFASDVIATSAFGVNVNSLEYRTNEFYMMGKKSTYFGTVAVMKFMLLGIAPKVAQLINIRLFSVELSKFYHELVHGTIAYRQKNNIIRPDMIHLLVEARMGSLKREAARAAKAKGTGEGFASVDEVNSELVHGTITYLQKNNIIPDMIHLLVEACMGSLKREAAPAATAKGTGEGLASVDEVNSEDFRGTEKQVWEDEDLTAQCFLFFLYGFDTSSTLLCFTASELMENPDVQQTLIAEVDEVKEHLCGKTITYDVLQKMQYLDIVISESLRKWPPAELIDRQCVKPYEMEDETGRKIKLNKGDGVWIPILAIHRDPDFYPEPDRFDPERFSDERKDSIKAGTYLPFGSGPRNCIGSPFVLMECKAFIYTLLTTFTFEPAANSTIPLRMSKAGFSMEPENGFNIQLKPRFQ